MIGYFPQRLAEMKLLSGMMNECKLIYLFMFGDQVSCSPGLFCFFFLRDN